MLFYTWRSASAHAHPRVHGGPEQEEPAPAGQLDLARADAMREQLRALFSEVGPVGLMGAAETAPAPAPSEASESGVFETDADYVMFVLQRDFLPLALDCYKRALGRTPGLAGRVWMRVDVIGDNGGGVVGDTSIEGAPLGDAELQICLRESMLSVSFDAPPAPSAAQHLALRAVTAGVTGRDGRLPLDGHGLGVGWMRGALDLLLPRHGDLATHDIAAGVLGQFRLCCLASLGDDGIHAVAALLERELAQAHARHQCDLAPDPACAIPRAIGLSTRSTPPSPLPI